MTAHSNVSTSAMGTTQSWPESTLLGVKCTMCSLDIVGHICAAYLGSYRSHTCSVMWLHLLRKGDGYKNRTQ